jgi:hypothetical protein
MHQPPRACSCCRRGQYWARPDTMCACLPACMSASPACCCPAFVVLAWHYNSLTGAAVGCCPWWLPHCCAWQQKTPWAVASWHSAHWREGEWLSCVSSACNPTCGSHNCLFCCCQHRQGLLYLQCLGLSCCWYPVAKRLQPSCTCMQTVDSTAVLTDSAAVKPSAPLAATNLALKPPCCHCVVCCVSVCVTPPQLSMGEVGASHTQQRQRSVAPGCRRPPPLC